tara:strand:- start:691 stop:1665 length:975 start_codon:yes stop_codon:yes gene_type:complete
MNPDYWFQRNVFITGATGFLGSWLAERLVYLKANVTILDRDYIPQSRLNRESITVSRVKGCLEDYDVLERSLNEHEIQTVFHLGAQTIVGIANLSPLSTFEANIRGTYHLLEACRRIGHVENIVIASSDKAYGEQTQLPYDETFSLIGSHPYDVSKSCADLIARSYFLSYQLPICITRCGNFYGGGDLNFNRLIPGTIRSVLKGEAPLIRSDGQSIRDYFYVEEAVSAYILLAEKMKDLPIQGEAFNFSNEIQKTALEIVELILDLMGCKGLRPEILRQASNEIPKQYLSAAKARKILSWDHQFSLEDGLRKTISWYKDFLPKR